VTAALTLANVLMAPVAALISKRAARVPEGGGARSSGIRQIHRTARTTLVRPPGARHISKTESRGKYQQQNRDGKHGSRSGYRPAGEPSFQSCDEFMISNAENVVIR
jgi:hypothetical protein